MNLVKINWRQAAPEFVIIVVGVLAALAVGQWADYRNDRELEVEYLDRLRVDLRADIQNFTRLERVFETKARIIQDLLDQSVPALLSRNPEELMQDLEYSGYTALPANQSATYNELLSTGRLALVQNVALIDALLHYYKEFELISGILFKPIGDYRLLLYESMPGMLIYEWRLSRTIKNPDDLRRGLETLQSNPGLESAANVEITYSTSLIFYLRQFRQEAEELLKLLDK